MVEWFTFWLVVLTGLLGYLSGKGLLRAVEGRCREREVEIPGRAFDVSAISQRMERVRREHVSFAHRHGPPDSFRAMLVETARRFVRGLAYFHYEESSK